MVASRTKPYRILIADDDAAFRDTLKVIFQPFLRLVEAASGEEAVEIVECEQIDIVLLDMHMREMTGLETLQIVKSIDALIPCILVTAAATETLKSEASEAEAYSVLEKPVRKSQLLHTVSTALEDAYRDPDAFSL